MSESTPEAAARELRQSILFNIMPNTFAELERLNADKDRALAALLTEWKQLGEREGMERAARLCLETGNPEAWSAVRERLAVAIRREAASLGTLKEPASGCQKAPSREAEAPTRGPEAPSGFKSGASPQSETPLTHVYHHTFGDVRISKEEAEALMRGGATQRDERDSDGATMVGGSESEAAIESSQVRAAEQKVLAMAEAWRDSRGASRRNDLAAAVDELRAARARS